MYSQTVKKWVDFFNSIRYIRNINIQQRRQNDWKISKTKKEKTTQAFFGVGVVLDYRSVGRFYPSTELKVHWVSCKTGSQISSIDIELVEFLNENR